MVAEIKEDLTVIKCFKRWLLRRRLKLVLAMDRYNVSALDLARKANSVITVKLER